MLQEDDLFRLKDTFSQIRSKLTGELSESYEEAIQGYAHQFSSIFRELPTEKRFLVLGDLERFIFSKMEEYLFDGVKAREARERAGLKQSEIARKFGFSQQFASAFETGIARPSSSTLPGRKYLEFLAQNGYDPYGIFKGKIEENP